MRECIHPCCRCNCRGQFHGNHGVCKYYFCQQFWRKKDFFLVGFIISNDGTSSNFTASACCCRYGDKMGNIVGYINVTSNKVIIFKQILPVIDTKDNCPGNIQSCSATNANYRISFGFIINSCTRINIRLYGIFMYLVKYFSMNLVSLQ